MTTGPMTSWQIKGENMAVVTDYYYYYYYYYYLVAKINSVTEAMKLKDASFLEGKI